MFAVIIVAAIIKVGTYFFAAGYLPDPFFQDAYDTFMDWYNTSYWVYQKGPYTDWSSVYPPFSFLFLRVFTNPACYTVLPSAARACDGMGVWVILTFFVLNIPLIFFSFRKLDGWTAIPRTVAVGLGMPMLYALERGNLIIPCFTFTALAYGPLLRSAWQRWICVAVTINFKVYMILPLASQLLARRWRWVESATLVTALLYAASFAIFGKGSPLELLYDVMGFSSAPFTFNINTIEYTSSYNAFMALFNSAFPIMHFLGSQPMEVAEIAIPIVIRAGQAVVMLVFLGAVAYKGAVSPTRLVALSLALVFTTSGGAGGYAEGFLFFFVLMEEWKGFLRPLMIVCTYLLCVPWDYQLVTIARDYQISYLSQRVVGHNTVLTFGEMTRPAILLLVQYALAAISLMDIHRVASGRAFAPLAAGRGEVALEG